MYNDLYGTISTESIIDATMYNEHLMGLFFGIMIFSSIIGLIIIISYWKIFKKAGKPGWASIIPIYNNIVMIQIAKLPIWFIILLFIPIANIYALFKIYIEIAKKFGKTSGFGIGMALLSVIFIPLLAFSDSKYEDVVKEETINNNTMDATNVNNNQEISINNENPINSVQETIPTEIDIPVDSIPVSEPIVSSSEISVEPTVAPILNAEPIAQTNENLESNTNIPTYETQNSVVTEPVVNSEPTLEVEPVITPDVEPVINNTDEPIQTPVTPQLEPQNTTINAFNSTPIMTDTVVNKEPEVLETPIIEQISETSNEPEIEPQIITEIPSVSTEQKNLCKNCGTEMPDIVSICPNCGTDNE